MRDGRPLFIHCLIYKRPCRKQRHCSPLCLNSHRPLQEALLPSRQLWLWLCDINISYCNGCGMDSEYSHGLCIVSPSTSTSMIIYQLRRYKFKSRDLLPMSHHLRRGTDDRDGSGMLYTNGSVVSTMENCSFLASV
jgi:hypothetical protein